MKLIKMILAVVVVASTPVLKADQWFKGDYLEAAEEQKFNIEFATYFGLDRCTRWGTLYGGDRVAEFDDLIDDLDDAGSDIRIWVAYLMEAESYFEAEDLLEELEGQYTIYFESMWNVPLALYSEANNDHHLYWNCLSTALVMRSSLDALYDIFEDQADSRY